MTVVQDDIAFLFPKFSIKLQNKQQQQTIMTTAVEDITPLGSLNVPHSDLDVPTMAQDREASEPGVRRSQVSFSSVERQEETEAQHSDSNPSETGSDNASQPPLAAQSPDQEEEGLNATGTPAPLPEATPSPQRERVSRKSTPSLQPSEMEEGSATFGTEMEIGVAHFLEERMAGSPFFQERSASALPVLDVDGKWRWSHVRYIHCLSRSVVT